MEEACQEFLDFDWSDGRWTAYLDGLYPPPNHRQLLRFKKKWYKKNVDPEFDDTYEPPCDTPNGGAPGGDARGSGFVAASAAAAAAAQLPDSAFTDGTKWQVMGKKATICFAGYAAALIAAIGGFAVALPPYQGLMALCGGFVLELLAKYGIKFSQEYMRHMLFDDTGVMPIMVFILLTPGMSRVLRTACLVSPFLTAVMSFALICKYNRALPRWVQTFFSPLAEPAARFKIMRVRGHAEVALGFLLVAGMLMARATPFTVLLYWNFMMMRYMMSHWTQSSFEAIDNVLAPACNRIPGVKQGYAAMKRKIFSFVDPDSKQAGRLCAIL